MVVRRRVVTAAWDEAMAADEWLAGEGAREPYSALLPLRIGGEHGAEQGALLDRVVQRDVGVW